LSGSDIYNEAHYVASNILFFNAKFVCSVDKYQPPHLQWCRNDFWTGRGQKI